MTDNQRTGSGWWVIVFGAGGVLAGAVAMGFGVYKALGIALVIVAVGILLLAVDRQRGR